VPNRGIAYESDGISYTAQITSSTKDSRLCGCFFEMRDGVLVKWPDYLGPDFGGRTVSQTD
jgi:hypothetical protein